MKFSSSINIDPKNSVKRDTLLVPFKAPVTTLAPSIGKLSNKPVQQIGFVSTTQRDWLKKSRHFFIQSEVKPKPIAHVRCINTLTWLRGFRIKIVFNFF